jgi:hypothetical protein
VPNPNWYWLIPVFLFAVSLFVALDAKKKRIPTTGDEYSLGTGSCVWFLGCFLFIWVVLPEYLYRRSSVLRWRAQRLTWDEGTNFCGDYIVRKGDARIVILLITRWVFAQIILVAMAGFCGLLGIWVLVIATIDWLQAGAADAVYILAGLFCGLLAVFFVFGRWDLIQQQLPWVLDRHADVLFKGDKPLRPLSSISHIELTASRCNGNMSWEVTFAPALTRRWWQGAPRDSFVFDSEVAARSFATELAMFLRGHNAADRAGHSASREVAVAKAGPAAERVVPFTGSDLLY